MRKKYIPAGVKVILILAMSISWFVTKALAGENHENTKIGNDLEFIETVQRPISEWVESEKALYKNILKNDSFDILVVPFQVQDYGIDRIGRSLMTRYLVHRIETDTEFNIPNPTFVARALGERERRFSDEDIRPLADSLGVKTVIKGYVGHNRDEKLKLTILVETKTRNKPFDFRSETIVFEWKDIPFSDNYPPEEGFRKILDDVMSKMPFPKIKKAKTETIPELGKLDIPRTIQDVTEKTGSPLIDAYYLQFLGTLFPGNNDSIAKEQLFERSLVELSQISAKSSDYAFLKARALFYLYRRPAALAALNSPNTPQEKALAALLDGNLPELEKTVEQIKSPLPKMLMQIDLNDLHWSYHGQRLLKEDAYKKIQDDFPFWEMLITRRLNDANLWMQQSNIEIKQKLDESFPLEGFTAKSIIKKLIALGRLPFEADEVDFSPYNHYKILLEKNGEKFCCLKDSIKAKKMDYLDLLYAVGESNLIRNAKILLFMQGLPENAREDLDRYNTIYSGHPEISWLKAEALRQISLRKQSQIAANLEKEANEHAYNACYWSQGQTEISTFSCRTGQLFYDGDYPRRNFWAKNTAGDREIVKNSPIEKKISSIKSPAYIEKYKLNRTGINKDEISLLYTHNDFYSLIRYYEDLYNIGLNAEAETLLEQNKYRFIGNPRRTSFFAEKAEKENDTAEAKRSYEEIILRNRDQFEPYLELGKIYIKEGNFKKASEIFESYTPFNHSKNFDRVKLSNFAQNAGNELLYVGAFTEAEWFFNLSAGYGTGSGAEMFSKASLAFLAENYSEAASHFLQCANRYNVLSCRVFYIAMLHLAGQHDEAWAIFDDVFESNSGSPGNVFKAAFIGHRIDGKTNEEIRNWLMNEKFNKIAPAYTGELILLTHTIDRPPNPQLAEILEEKSLSFRNRGKSVINKNHFTFHLAWFANGHYALRKKEFSRAFLEFKKNNFLFEKRSYELYRYALPYIAWSGVKSDNLQEVEELLNGYKTKCGKDFYYHLSNAFIYGGKGNHLKAIDHLNNSWYNVQIKENPGPIFSWHELIQAAEWLYEDTGRKEYRDLALKWAKIYQRIFPIYSWSYAIEAKLTDNEKDRTRALALTLYLDKHSERAATFTKAEKEKAGQWLKENNPFLKKNHTKGHAKKDI